jgi:DNA invertase Pin-like site-specific DNA recombinase
VTEITPRRRLRCAVYTRKSSEEGLDMEFNSLDAQREACEAYITSQKAEGWVPVRDRYDDGGFSGGTLDRPRLRALIRDIEAGLVDVIVVIGDKTVTNYLHATTQVPVDFPAAPSL